MQSKSWIHMQSRGDWVLEKRISNTGGTRFFLCVMGDREEVINDVPSDLVEILIKGGATVVESSGWD